MIIKSGIELRKDPVKTQESDSNTKNQTDKEEKLMFQQTETAAADQITTKIVEPTSAGINIKSENIDYSKTLNYENIDELTIIKSEATSTTTTKYEVLFKFCKNLKKHEYYTQTL